MFIKATIVGNTGAESINKKCLINLDRVDAAIEGGPETSYVEINGRSALIDFPFPVLEALIKEFRSVRPLPERKES